MMDYNACPVVTGTGTHNDHDNSNDLTDADLEHVSAGMDKSRSRPLVATVNPGAAATVEVVRPVSVMSSLSSLSAISPATSASSKPAGNSPGGCIGGICKQR